MAKNNFDVNIKVKYIEANVTQATLGEEVDTTGQYMNRLLKKDDSIMNRLLRRGLKFSAAVFSLAILSTRRTEMPSSKDCLNYILKQLSEAEGITYRAMMGEYIAYYRDKVVDGIYDDRFLVKPTKTATAMMPNANMELPYGGAKEMSRT